MGQYELDCLSGIDLKKNGLFETVQAEIEKNRKGDFSVRVTDANGKPMACKKVRITQTKHAFKFGSTAFLADVIKEDAAREKYESLFAKLFNQGVLAFYWRDDEPTRGHLRFDKGSPYIYRRPPADEALEFCKRVGCEPKGHNMLWQNEDIGLPTWFPSDKEDALHAILERIEILAKRYADQIPVWDVTNECTVAPGLAKMPLNYDTHAWLAATKWFPHNHLILNDYNAYFGNYYREMSAVYLQAQKLMAQGARVDGIGIQYHLFRKEEDLPRVAKNGTMINAAYMRSMLDCYAQLGTALHISEITVPSYGYDPAKLQMQADMVENLYRVWFAHPSVSSIVWWNLADGYAFVNPKQNEDYYCGGLLCHDFSPKPAYERLEQLICREWHTETTAETDADGMLRFRGFYGDYELTLDAANAQACTNLQIPKEETKTWTLMSGTGA